MYRSMIMKPKILSMD